MRNANLLWTAVAAALLASAGSADAQHAPPVAYPQAFAGVAASRSAGFSSEDPAPAFWRELGDTVLTRLVETALEANPDVQLAAARVREARQARRLAVLDL